MNDQPQRTTFFGACPHDCPDTCAMIYEVEDGRLVERIPGRPVRVVDATGAGKAVPDMGAFEAR